MHNLIVANIKAGQIITQKLAAAEIPEQMIRDGWVEVHREKPPRIHVVSKHGGAFQLFSDRQSITLEHTDLDLSGDPDGDHEKLVVSLGSLFCYSIPE